MTRAPADFDLPPPSQAPTADTAAVLRAIEAELLAMPPVAAIALRLVGYEHGRLRLHAPLSANINDKGSAFGGSLTSLMTLAGWSLVSLHVAEARLQAEVFVAQSEVRYRAPLYADLEAAAWLAEGESVDAFLQNLRSGGKARLHVLSEVVLPDGGIACAGRSRFSARLKT